MSFPRGGTFDRDELGRLGRGAPSWMERACHHRRLGGAGVRRWVRGSGGGGSGGGGFAPAPTMPERIAAIMAAESWEPVCGYVAAEETVTVVDPGGDDHASVLLDVYGSHPALQAADAARPEFSSTGLAGGPGLVFTGGQYLVTADPIDVTGYSALVWFCVCAQFSSTGIVGSLSGGASQSLIYWVNGATWQISSSNGADDSVARTAVTTGSDPAVRVGTWDTGLSADESEVRLNGSNITGSRPLNDDCSSPLDPNLDTVSIGANAGGGASLADSAVGAVYLFAGPTSVPLPAVAAVEAELSAALAAGDYLS